MALPLLLKLGGTALAALFLFGKEDEEPVAAPTDMPISERMARVLATNDPNAIRFEAGRLKQEGHAARAAELEAAAAQLDREIASGGRPAPVYPPSAPPAAAPTGPISQPPSVGPLPAGSVTSAGVPQPHGAPSGPIIPPGVVLPLPVLGAGVVLHYMPPPAPYDPRVQAWQTKLLSLGISVGAAGADGKFGAGTRDGTRAFQTKANALAKAQGGPQIGVNGMLDAATLARAAMIVAWPAPGAKPPAAAAPPIVVQTPAGPVVVPAVMMPAPMPAPQPAPAAKPPAAVSMHPVGVPLPVLGPKEILSRASPGQTTSEKTRLWQLKLVSLGLLAMSDAIGKFGPTTETATKHFQSSANEYLKRTGKAAIQVDGRVGPQTLALAALAHPPNASGALWGAFGGPMAASPLPGIMPAMAPAPIDPRIALAAQLLDNLSRTSPGHEDNGLVQAFQAQEGLRASGFYQPSTALALARRGFIPPAPRYWPATGRGKAKRAYARELRAIAKLDPQRREEWERAALN